MKNPMHAPRLLIVAPIGDPAVWRRAHYVIQEKTHKTCCSAIALTLFNTQKYSTVNLLLVAMDSLICSKLLGEWSPTNMAEENQRLSETLENLFKQELKKAAERAKLSTTEQDNKLTVQDSEVRIKVAISQSIGQYPVNRANAPLSSIRFNGDPTAVFAKIVNTAGLYHETDTILDLTHGVNYLQTMAIYAIETLKSFRKSKVTMHNSSPYPITYMSPHCFAIPQQPRPKLARIEKEPSLNIFDVSGLLEVSSLAASFSQFTLNRRNVETIRKSVMTLAEKYKWQNFTRLARHVTLGWYYLTSGLVTFGYFHAAKANSLATQARQIEEMLQELKKGELDLEFKSEGDIGKVLYKNLSDWQSSMPTIVWSMHHTLNHLLKPISPRVVTVEKLMKATSMLANENPLYSSMVWRLSHEKRNIWRGLTRTKLKEFAVGVNENLREKFFGTRQKLSSCRDTKEKRRHLVSHVGMTCEPITHISFRDKVSLTLELGALGDDPFDMWRLS